MDSPGVMIYEHQFATGSYGLDLNQEKVYSTYLVSGKLQINGEVLEKDGFAILEDGQNAGVKALEDSRLFVIETPRSLDYPTYRQLMQSRFSS